MKSIATSFLFFFFSALPIGAYAEVINFACAGTGFLTGVGSSPENINITVDTSNGEMWGFQGGLVPGCRSDGVFRSKEHKCTINSVEAHCSCSNELGISSIVFSRATGELKTLTQLQGKGGNSGFRSGAYFCKRVERNLF